MKKTDYKLEVSSNKQNEANFTINTLEKKPIESEEDHAVQANFTNIFRDKIHQLEHEVMKSRKEINKYQDKTMKLRSGKLAQEAVSYCCKKKVVTS